MYYAIPGRAQAWRRFYRQFVGTGDICFDLGAHVGNRTAALLSLGARVVAVEPQPLFARTLRRLFGKSSRFSLVEKAVGSERGRRTMLLSTVTPTVSSTSRIWVEGVSTKPGFVKVAWDKELTVAVTTLDQLIKEYGSPVLCKLDIEGSELQALQGLTQPVPALSFEYLPAAVDTSLQCIDYLQELGAYQFNIVAGEYPKFEFTNWVGPEQAKSFLRALPFTARAGEVYAKLTHD
jgi:FkbM family methyltransferase